MKLVYQLDKIVSKILQLIVVIMLSVMSVVVFAQVIFMIIHISIPWS